MWHYQQVFPRPPVPTYHSASPDLSSPYFALLSWNPLDWCTTCRSWPSSSLTGLAVFGPMDLVHGPDHLATFGKILSSFLVLPGIWGSGNGGWLGFTGHEGLTRDSAFSKPATAYSIHFWANYNPSSCLEKHSRISDFVPWHWLFEICPFLDHQ